MGSEQKRDRKRLAAGLLKVAYVECAKQSVADRHEASTLKYGQGQLSLEQCQAHRAISNVIEHSAYVNRLCDRRKQRALHLRHLHLARAFLKGVPYRAVEACPDWDRAGYRGPNTSYICDIINGQLALAETIELADVGRWVLDGMFEHLMTNSGVIGVQWLV